MFKRIKKRDGRTVKFDAKKISEAIKKAGLATGEFGEREADKLTLKVLSLAQNTITAKTPTVEEIQDIVEEVLLSSPYRKTAKAYIIYREQHAGIRRITAKANVDLMDQYLDKLDWQVNENSNMAFSLQGLNNYISSEVSKVYWLNKVYPPEIREAHLSGDFHIHDLGLLANYCIGWDLEDLLVEGFKGASGKMQSRPAKHFRSALGQVVNFLYTLQGECYSKDTEVLTDSGWKYFYKVKKDDKIFTLNNQTNEIELQSPIKFYKFDYSGELYNFKSKKMDLLVTPNHNMVVDQYSPYCKKGRYRRKIVKAKDFNANEHNIPKHSVWKGKERKWFILPEIKIKQYRNFTKRYVVKKIDSKKILMNDWLKFFGFYIAEGNTYRRKRTPKDRKPYFAYNIRIFQNEGKESEDFEDVLKTLAFNYRKKVEKGNKVVFEIEDKQLYAYLEQFGKANDKYLPRQIKELCKPQLKILFDWMMKGDGYIANGNVEYSTRSKRLADDFQEIVLKLGWNANIYERRKGKFKWYDIGISRTRYFKLGKESIKKELYKGKVYCLEVSNHTLYVRRNGKACWCGNSAGAVAFSNFDTLLSPFIYYDKLAYPEVKQAMQEFIFNMNVPTRTGFQTPFSNITLDLDIPSIYAERAVIIGGKPQERTYKEFQREMDMFNRAFLEVMLEGDAKGRVFSFPIPTYNISKDFDWDNPKLKLLWEVTGKYGLPYFANFINSDMKPEDARSMCCRLRIDNRKLYKRGGGLFGSSPLTGSIGVVTINMPRLGYFSETKEEFLQRLERLMLLARNSLEIKRKILEKFTDGDLYPYAKFYLRNIKKRFGQYWKNHFSTIGLVGMNEACLNFLGKDIGTEEGRKFAVEVLNFMRSKLLEFQKETGNNYNLEATPAEGVSYRLPKLDKEKYPQVICANEEEYKKGAKPFYTNSSQLSVNYTDDVFEALDLQDEIQGLYTGGTVLHLFAGEEIKDFQAVKSLVRRICENYHLPYFTLTPTFSVCPTHGYIAGEHSHCPECGAECEVYSRVVGYLRPVKQWNEGKKEEFKQRKAFKI
ncbi:MAG: ribonucleoside triphosphate reductase [Candidatus Omnitrophica bacterium]|nr:ribonucleoside triphosphate reductase [Candidatus Omnitrophota bacterium]